MCVRDLNKDSSLKARTKDSGFVFKQSRPSQIRTTSLICVDCESSPEVEPASAELWNNIGEEF